MIIRLFSVVFFSGLFSLSISVGCTSKNGRVVESVFSSVALGSGVIMKSSVSVCY